MRRVACSVVLALLASAWCVGAASAVVISLVTQERTVTARATVSPHDPPGPDQIVDQAQPAADFTPFTATAAVSLGNGGPTLASGEATQNSTITGALVHADGSAIASGGCDLPNACGAGNAKSSFAIRFSVPAALMVHIVGRVQTSAGTPQLRFVIDGPGVTLVSDGNGGNDEIDLDALLTPGEYRLEAHVQADAGDSGSFTFDANFDAVLVGVEALRWGDVKQRFR